MDVMNLRDKSLENKNVAERCLKWNLYNAGVSRAYYSAFQMAKHYLISNDFGYSEFLKKYPDRFPQDRHYSHHSLSFALLNYLKDMEKKDYFKASVLDTLFKKRTRADYGEKKTDVIDKVELEESLNELDIILGLLT